MSKCKHDFAPAGQGMSVTVRGGNIDQALRALGKKNAKRWCFKRIQSKETFYTRN